VPVVHVRAMKIYVVGVEALRKEEKRGEDGMKSVYHKN
jgi:hypothetical protein